MPSCRVVVLMLVVVVFMVVMLMVVPLVTVVVMVVMLMVLVLIMVLVLLMVASCRAVKVVPGNPWVACKTRLEHCGLPHAMDPANHCDEYVKW